jgi:hypothetical protein
MMMRRSCDDDHDDDGLCVIFSHTSSLNIIILHLWTKDGHNIIYINHSGWHRNDISIMFGMIYFDNSTYFLTFGVDFFNLETKVGQLGLIYVMVYLTAFLECRGCDIVWQGYVYMIHCENWNCCCEIMKTNDFGVLM